MSTWTNLRAMVRADLLARVEEKATGEGRTVQDVVTALLTAYVQDKPRKPRSRPRKKT